MELLPDILKEPANKVLNFSGIIQRRVVFLDLKLTIVPSRLGEVSMTVLAFILLFCHGIEYIYRHY